MPMPPSPCPRPAAGIELCSSSRGLSHLTALLGQGNRSTYRSGPPSVDTTLSVSSPQQHVTGRRLTGIGAIIRLVGWNILTEVVGRMVIDFQLQTRVFDVPRAQAGGGVGGVSLPVPSETLDPSRSLQLTTVLQVFPAGQSIHSRTSSRPHSPRLLDTINLVTNWLLHHHSHSLSQPLQARSQPCPTVTVRRSPSSS